MGGDASTFEDDRDKGIVMTSMERHVPTAAFIGSGRDMERCGDIPMLRKRAASTDAAVEREVKQMRSPCPLEASLASHPPASSVAGHAG